MVHIYKGRKRERESGLKEDENNYKSDDIYVSGIALGHGFKEVWIITSVWDWAFNQW